MKEEQIIINNKYKTILMILSLGVVLIFSCFLFLKENKKEDDISKNNDALKIKEEYEKLNDTYAYGNLKYPKVSLEEDNPFVYVDEKKIVETLESGTGLIYLGFPKCPWCRNAINVLQYVNIDEILYLDMTDKRDTYEMVNGTLTKTKDASKEYYKMLELLDSILMDYEVDNVKVGEKRIYVPIVIAVKDGKIVGHHTDTVELDINQNAYDLLNKKQQSDLKVIYDKLTSEATGASCGLTPEHGC